MSPGEKRRRQAKRERERIAAAAAIAALPVGSSCGNCKHRLKKPAGLKNDACDLDSDWEGYAVIRNISEVCPRWKPAVPAVSSCASPNMQEKP